MPIHLYMHYHLQMHKREYLDSVNVKAHRILRSTNGVNLQCSDLRRPGMSKIPNLIRGTETTYKAKSPGNQYGRVT